MTPEQQQLLLEHQTWVAVLWLSVVTFIAILIAPTKEVDEDGNVINTDNEDNLARRRKDMQCYGKHDWIVNSDGLRRCKKCNYEYQDDVE